MRMERQAILGTTDELGGDKVMAAKLLGIGKRLWTESSKNTE